MAAAFLSLAAGAGHAPGQGESPLKARLAAARDRHQRTSESLAAAHTAAERAAARARYRDERRRDLSDLLDQAERRPDDPEAAPTVQFVIFADDQGSIGVLDRAIALIARDHPRRAGMGHYARYLAHLFFASTVESFDREVLAKHPAREGRAEAALGLADWLRIKTHMARHLRKYPEQIPDYEDRHGAAAIARFVGETDPDATEKAAEAAYERVVKEFGDVRLPRSPRSLGEVAAGELNAIRDIRVGHLAPEIEGVDVDGERFMLSDLRGKVVLLVFSGEWYPECTEMYARQRALLKLYAREPLALVNVNTDPTPDKLRASIKAGRVTWRCWWDGGPNGPIATSWAVKGYPYVYVLDIKGVIRHSNVRDEAMEDAVAELLRKAKG
jgi:peroxiredoxin